MPTACFMVPTKRVSPRVDLRLKGYKRKQVLEILWMKWPAVQLLIQPTQHANLSGAERFQPAVDQKISLRGCGRYLGGLGNDGGCGTQVQLISGGDIFGSFRGLIERVY